MLDDLNIDYKGRLTLCCQLSNYRDAQGDGDDVVGDLKKIGLPAALNNLMNLVTTVHKERLAMAADPQQKDKTALPLSGFAWNGSAKPANNRCWCKSVV